MTLARRKFLHFAGGAIALSSTPRSAWAEIYPSRPVRFIVGFPAAGGADIIARLVGQWLSERLGQPFVIENRPGAGSNIAAELVLRAPADGHTLLLVTSTNAINATVYENLKFNFIRDIAPVAGLNREVLIMMVTPSMPVRKVPEFIAYAKANPGKLNMAFAGKGTPQHVAGELFKMMTGVDMVDVPYRGSAAALTELMARRVEVTFETMTASIEYIRSGKMYALGVSGAMRSEALPDIPTVSEFVPGYEAPIFRGVGAPKNTPAEIIGKLNKEINAALADPQIKARIANLGSEPMPMTPDDFARLMADETEKWGKVIRAANIKAE